MKLDRWLKLTGISQTELSAMVGCSVSTINRHIKHGRVLDPEVIVRIFFVTMGAVRPDDFYDLDNMPPEIAALMNSAKAHKIRAASRQVTQTITNPSVSPA